MWLDNTRGRLEVLARGKCSLVLVDIRPWHRNDIEGRAILKYGPRNVRGWLYKFDDCGAFYVSTAIDVQNSTPHVARAVSAAFSQIDNYVYNSSSTVPWLKKHFKPNVDAVMLVQKIVKPIKGEFDRAAITGEHHTHLMPEEVWDLVHDDRLRTLMMAYVLGRLRKVRGVTESLVATVLLYIAAASLPIAMMFSSSQVIDYRSVDLFHDSLKKLSVPLKSMQSTALTDLTELFELNVLVNRGVGKINWENEKRNRVQPDTINVDPLAVYNSAMNVFGEGMRHGFVYATMSLDDYVSARWEWAPSGSVHSQYDDDKAYIARNYRHRSKFTTLNRMSSSRVKSFLGSPPQIRAWPSIKYEWGKERAIYGVDLRNTVITNFAMYRCEDVLRHRFPVGEEAEAGRVHKRLVSMLSGGESLCYDFDDFNAQHSTSSMHAVLAAYRDSFADRMSPDQLRAMNWVVDSVLDTAVMKESQIEYRARGTLFSGWRLTTFINSVLNFVYMDIAGVFSVEGVIDSVHNGDDVLLSVVSPRAVTSVFDLMSAINARAQTTKCNAFSISEFLRVEHKITTDEGLGSQYLTRACATMVHSRTESQAPVRMTEAVSAIRSRVSELYSRTKLTSDFKLRLESRLLRNISKVFGQDYRVAEQIYVTHLVAGGVSSRETSPVDVVITASIPESVTHYPEDGVTPGQLQPGAYDYSRLLQRKLQGVVSFDTIHKAVSRATRAILAITRDEVIQVTSTRDVKYKYARALYGYYRGRVSLPGLSKAQFLGIPPLALTTQATMNKVMTYLGHVSDPLWCLKVLL